VSFYDFKLRAHDYLTLCQTHNLKGISYDEKFVAEGCDDAHPAVTMQAGVQWKEAYAFAEAHNITLAGVGEN
jgi:hypothetical protein